MKCKYLELSGVLHGKYETTDDGRKGRRISSGERKNAVCRCKVVDRDDCPKIGTLREGSTYDNRGNFRPRVTPVCCCVQKLEKLRLK